MANTPRIGQPRRGLDERGKRWYAVVGKSAFGPYDLYDEAKHRAGLADEDHATEVLERGGLYRYGGVFIGTAKLLAEFRITDIPSLREANAAGRTGDVVTTPRPHVVRVEVVTRLIYSDGSVKSINSTGQVSTT